MPIELIGAWGELGLSNHTWEELLILAQTHGWTPQDAPGEPWEPYFFAGDGHEMSERDARSLASALHLAIHKQNEFSLEFLQEIIHFCKQGKFTIE